MRHKMYCKHFMTLFGDYMKICIIGNSKRLNVLKQNIENTSHDVTLYENEADIPKEISADIIVLPIPTLNRDGNLNIESVSKISADELIKRIKPDSLIISCGYTNTKRTVVDLNLREDFAYLNAVPTAEGAIFYALSNIDRSLFECNILITGFGRVAKVLADRLKSLCNTVTISARSQKDLAYAKALNFKTVNLSGIKDNISDFDLIFQTVPAKIITDEIIDKMRSDTVIVELSSKSVGTDFEYAANKKIKVVHAPALPEKIAPITAGNILTRSVLSIITEQNFRSDM